MPNGLDPDQDRRSVGPDLGSNSLQRLSDDESRCMRKYGCDVGIVVVNNKKIQ